MKPVSKETIEHLYHSIEECIFDGKIKEALEHLRKLILISSRGQLTSQLESIDKTYHALLEYAIKGIEDPDRERILNEIRLSVFELSDISRQMALMNGQAGYAARMKKRMESQSKEQKEEASEMMEDLVFDMELDSTLKENRPEDKLAATKSLKKQYDIVNHLFFLVWLTDKFTGKDENLVNRIIQNNAIHYSYKSIIVSALTLSLHRCFDEKKLLLLIDLYMKGEEQISQRALVGLISGLMIHSGRIGMYEKVLSEIRLLNENEDFRSDVRVCLIQWLKSKDTAKITKKLEDEILPEMARFQPRLREKLDLENIVPEDMFEDKNPNWERVFEDSPDLLDKLQEFSQMQMEGSDVFMSAFSQLKHFSFFREMSNWFMPFFPENPEVTNLLNREKETFDVDLFLTMLEKSSYMCNSDKYSFCFNLQFMPASQKKVMMEMFNAEMEGMLELAREDELLNQSAKIKSIYSRYFHDLYRFFKLYPEKSDFTDIFELDLSFLEDPVFSIIAGDEETLRNMAEFLFGREYWDEALRVYLILNSKGDNSRETFEKIGYCHHRKRNYKTAIDWYAKAELYDSNRAWNLKKIALCHRNLRNYEDSLKFYLEAEKLEPDNMYIKTFIGHNYLDMKEFRKALDYYFQVEVLSPENKKVLRPIAWCLFILGKFPEALKYTRALIRDKPIRYDFLNLGHIHLCLGEREKALKNYAAALREASGDISWFRDAFLEDGKYLESHGIDRQYIHWIVEYVQYSKVTGE